MKEFPTVIHAFIDSLATKPDDLAIHVTDILGENYIFSYASLYGRACEIAGSFLQRRLQPGDRIVLALSASADFYATYLGAWFYGLIPLVVLPPLAGRAIERNISSINSLVNKTGARLLIVPANSGKMENWACNSCTPHELSGCSPKSPGTIEPRAIAQLQCTSGSTGEPRLVVVRHGNIAANVLGIGKAIRHQPTDKLVSWLPLSHDMGLIGVSYSLGWQCPLIMAETSRFIRNPMSWFQMITDHKGTLSPAPNSAFLACVRLAKLRPPKAINLSTWRVALCGSEPIQEDTILEFQKTFKPFGFRPETMLPVYGLAETTLAATIPDPEIVPHVESIDMETMVREGRIEHGVAIAAKQKTRRFVALGSVLPEHKIRIVDAKGNIMPDKTVGEIELFGPSVMDGYWQDEDATTRILSPDGYLRTGDLGFLLDGQLYISGRKKDVIIVGGRTFAPAYIEEIVNCSLEPGFIKTSVAIGIPNKKTGTETLHLMIEGKPFLNKDEKTTAETSICLSLTNNCGISGISIYWAGRDIIPYTASGKVQRYLCKKIIQHQLEDCGTS